MADSLVEQMHTAVRQLRCTVPPSTTPREARMNASTLDAILEEVRTVPIFPWGSSPTSPTSQLFGLRLVEDDSVPDTLVEIRAVDGSRIRTVQVS